MGSVSTGMVGNRPIALPLALLMASAIAVLQAALAFVGSSTSGARALGSSRAGNLRAVPAGVVEGSSLATSLAVSTPGMWALTVLTLVPLSFLIILYLQSERYKAENGLTE